MTTELDELRAGIAPRDDGPLQTLLHSWAAARGKRTRLPFAQEQLLESINTTLCLNRSERTKSLDWSAKKFQRLPPFESWPGFRFNKASAVASTITDVRAAAVWDE